MRVSAETVETEGSFDHVDNPDNLEGEDEPVRTEWDRESLFKELKLDDLDIKESEKNELKELCWEYRSIFSTNEHDLGCSNFFEAHLELKENYKPRWVPSRPIPYKYQSEMGFPTSCPRTSCPTYLLPQGYCPNDVLPHEVLPHDVLPH